MNRLEISNKVRALSDAIFFVEKSDPKLVVPRLLLIIGHNYYVGPCAILVAPAPLQFLYPNLGSSGISTVALTPPPPTL